MSIEEVINSKFNQPHSLRTSHALGARSLNIIGLRGSINCTIFT